MDDHVTLRRCLPLNDAISASLVHAERQVVAGLGGDCHAAMGVLASWITVDKVHELGPSHYQADRPPSRQDRGQPHMRIRVRVLSLDGRQIVEADDHAPVRHATKL
ncbi:MAG: hypothetical protein HC898_02155 [Phycisphaerales bacterium]|nr:hypothetical protein [Phycisphaerales bacterium]